MMNRLHSHCLPSNEKTGRPIIEISMIIFSLLGGTNCLVRFAPNVEEDYSFILTQIIHQVAEIKLPSQVSHCYISI